MSSEWRETILGECVNFTSGNTPSKSNPDFWNGNIPWISAKDMKSFWVEDTKDHLTQEGLSVASRLIPAGTTLLLTRGMTLHNDIPIVRTRKPATFNQDVKALFPKGEIVPSYVPYLLLGNKSRIQALVDSAGHGTGRLNSLELKALLVRYPPVETQIELSALFCALDDRITLLRETNTTLEAIAQALFKSWFVDFDPVRAKQEGREPEGMDPDIAALFPDSFEESELGLVPKGWQLGTVEDLCDVITNGGTPSRSKAAFWDGGSIPWFKTGEFADGFLLTPSERITKEGLNNSSVKLLPEHAVLMAIYAAPTVGRLGILTEPATFNQACTGLVAKPTVGPWFLLWTLYFGRDWFNNRANGAAQQNISKAIVAGYKIVMPPPEIFAAFLQVSSALHKRIRTCSEHAQTLATLRDTLLPRLISGQLRLPDAEALVEEV